MPPTLTQINKTVRRQLGPLISGLFDQVPIGSPRVWPRGGAGLLGRLGFGGPMLEFLDSIRTPTKRKEEMEFYDTLEREISDVRRGLDAMATMAVTGDLTGGGGRTFRIELVNDEDSYPGPLRARLDRMDEMIRRHSYSCVREMCKYGSFAPALEWGRLPDRRLGVTRLRPIPPGTLYRKLQRDGTSDPSDYWKQIIHADGSSLKGTDGPGTNEPKIPQWVLPHFAIWSNIVTANKVLLYGTAVLQPFGKIGLMVQATLDATVVARLTRAAMRYVWKIDVTDLLKGGDYNAIQQRLRDWQRMMDRDANLLNRNANRDSYERASIPEDNIYIPSAENTGWGVDALMGDANVPRVQDIEMLTRFYFGALGVPPEYLGHSRSQGGRSNLSQVDIQFARLTRHIQMFAVPGFEHMVAVDMVLGGWSPLDYPVRVKPPAIGARDDLLKAQIRVLQSTVIGNLRAAGLDPSLDPRWLLETFMNLDPELAELDDEVVAKLFDMATELPTGGEGTTPRGDERRRVIELLSRQSDSLGAMLRENFKLLALNQDSFVGGLYHHDQPTVEELVEQVVTRLEADL